MSCLFLLITLVGLLAFVIIDDSINDLSSKENIVFSILGTENENKLFSGKNWNDEFQNYTLEIKTKNNENFVNPKFTASANVKVLNYFNLSSKINIQFYVKSGTSMFFELTADNFETSCQTFLTTPFDNVLEISFTNLLNESGDLYNLETEINNNVERFVLYFVEDSNNFDEAIKDEFPCTLNYATLINGQFAENCKVTSSQTNVLKVDAINKKILVKRAGTASISFQVSNESKEQKINKTINFIVKDVPVKNVINLCDTVEIDLGVDDEYNFEFEIVPHYSQNYSIKLSENSADDIIILNDKQIIGLKTGEVQVDFIINSEVFKIITIKILNQNDYNNQDDFDNDNSDNDNSNNGSENESGNSDNEGGNSENDNDLDNYDDLEDENNNSEDESGNSEGGNGDSEDENNGSENGNSEGENNGSDNGDSENSNNSNPDELDSDDSGSNGSDDFDNPKNLEEDPEESPEEGSDSDSDNENSNSENDNDLDNSDDLEDENNNSEDGNGNSEDENNGSENGNSEGENNGSENENNNSENSNNPDPDESDSDDSGSNGSDDFDNPENSESESEYFFQVSLKDINGVSFDAESNVLSVNLSEIESSLIRLEIKLVDKNNNQVDPAFEINILPEDNDFLLGELSSTNTGKEYEICLCISVEKAGSFIVSLSHISFDAELNINVVLLG